MIAAATERAITSSSSVDDMERNLKSVDITALNDLGQFDGDLPSAYLSPMPGTDICDELARYRAAPQSRTLISIVPTAHSRKSKSEQCWPMLLRVTTSKKLVCYVTLPCFPASD